MRADIGGEARVRVRTPGKHIVMFVTAAVVIVAAAINLTKSSPQSRVFNDRQSQAAQSGGKAVALNDFLVDLAPDRNGRVAYLRLSAVVMADSNDAAAAIDANRVAIAERLTFLLRGLSPEDFAGSDGMTLVKDEMRRRVNLVIAPARARDVVISDLIIQ